LAGVIGQNAVENNRMLHREEVDLIQNLAKEYAKEKGLV
jgi:filamentous hemagglutinin